MEIFFFGGYFVTYTEQCIDPKLYCMYMYMNFEFECATVVDICIWVVCKCMAHIREIVMIHIYLMSYRCGINALFYVMLQLGRCDKRAATLLVIQ